MKKLRRLDSAKETCELDLAARGREQIVTTNHQRHALLEIVDCRHELISPVAFAIAHEQVAALLRRPLFLRPVPQIVEALDRWSQTDAQSETRTFGQAFRGAGAGISKLALRLPCCRDVLSRTLARVDETGRSQTRERMLVDRASIALPDERLVGLEAEPFQILENRALVLRTAALPIVILDAQEDAASARLGDFPHVDGVDDVAQMKEAGGRRRKPTDDHERQRARDNFPLTITAPRLES